MTEDTVQGPWFVATRRLPQSVLLGGGHYGRGRCGRERAQASTVLLPLQPRPLPAAASTVAVCPAGGKADMAGRELVRAQLSAGLEPRAPSFKPRSSAWPLVCVPRSPSHWPRTRGQVPAVNRTGTHPWHRAQDGRPLPPALASCPGRVRSSITDGCGPLLTPSPAPGGSFRSTASPRTGRGATEVTENKAESLVTGPRRSPLPGV